VTIAAACRIVLQVSHLVLVTPGGKEFYLDSYQPFCRGALGQQIANCERARWRWERHNGESTPRRWAACASVE
jgi:hypothetical protein